MEEVFRIYVWERLVGGGSGEQGLDKLQLFGRVKEWHAGSEFTMHRHSTSAQNLLLSCNFICSLVVFCSLLV